MKLFFTILCLTGFLCSFGQRIEGRIIDGKRNEGLSYGTITLLSDTKKRHVGVSTETGFFTFDKVNPGKYSISFSALGYKDSTFGTVSITRDTTINLVYFNYCKYDNARNNKRCPVCHKKNAVIPIIYGLPISVNGEDRTNENGIKYILAGCEVTFCDPTWYCKRDKTSF